ncbi:MAG: formylglycine-generating enzyme family protein [Candidatus Latescibacterota bacterium]
MLRVVPLFCAMFFLCAAEFPPLPASSNEESGDSKAQDSAMVLIPGGEFLMGGDMEEDHQPIHQVRVHSFYLDRFEVSNTQYLEFCEATDRKLPEFWGIDRLRCGPDYPHHPVIGVCWADADAYAKWRGKRLPTEAEWEYAARGGLVGQKYPNGDAIDTTLANYYVSEGTVPVGSYAANGYGLHDMAGNVNEWVSDFYDDSYYADSPVDNPAGPETGKFYVIRGGGWHSGSYCNRVYRRCALISHWVDINVGFRCAKDLR